jgi:hypothetical protein
MSEADRQIFQQVVGQYGGPAFVRRGQAVQRAFDSVAESCRLKRDEWLQFVRIPLGTLVALAGSVAALQESLENPRQFQTLENLVEDLQPRLRLPPAPTTSSRVLARALAEVREAIERFNQRWQAFIAQLDLQHVNELREGYNRYYLLEKECAVGSIRVARQGFQMLRPVQPEDFLKIMPLLPVP